VTGLVSVIFFRSLSAAFARDFQHAVLLCRLPEETQPDQLTADGRPFRTTVFLANAVSRKLGVPPLANTIRCFASENINNVI